MSTLKDKLQQQIESLHKTLPSPLLEKKKRELEVAEYEAQFYLDRMNSAYLSQEYQANRVIYNRCLLQIDRLRSEIRLLSGENNE